MFRSPDVWSPRSWWADPNLECYYCSNQWSYFRSCSSFRCGSPLRSRDYCQADPSTLSATRDFLQNNFGCPSRLSPRPVGYLMPIKINTFCRPATQSILPMRPQNHGSRSPSRIPCPRSSIELFPEDDTEESTPAQQSLVSLSLEVPVIEILLDPLAFAPTLPSSWSLILLEVAATEAEQPRQSLMAPSWMLLQSLA